VFLLAHAQISSYSGKTNVLKKFADLPSGKVCKSCYPDVRFLSQPSVLKNTASSHTHTARSLACPPASSSLTHARRMDGFSNQNADQLGSPLSSSLTHARRNSQDGWFLQPKSRPARLPHRTVPSNCICRCSRMRARLSPPRVLLPHTVLGLCNYGDRIDCKKRKR
jgi:hypothetical protein